MKIEHLTKYLLSVALVITGAYCAKITFIRCLNSCVASVCENNQPVMIKIHPLIFL